MADANVTAIFTEISYTVTFEPGDGGSLLGDLIQSVPCGGDSTAVEAVPADCYSFQAWSDGSTDNPRTLTALMADANVTAIFLKQEGLEFTVTFEPGDGGSLLGDLIQSVPCGGDSNAVEAVPADCYSFQAWSDGSTDNPRIINDIYSNIELTANFIKSNPPLANAGSEQRVKAGEKVKLDASNSWSETGYITSYKWTQIDGNQVNLTNDTAVKPIFSAPGVDSNGEALVFKLTVTNTCDMEDMDICVVNISNPNDNVPPVADAGPNKLVVEGTEVTLDASGSLDIDGNIVSYKWEQIKGIDVILNNPDMAQATFNAPIIDNNANPALMFRLMVTDDGGLKSIDKCIVNISDKRPPNADAGEDQEVTEGTTVTLNGRNSTFQDGNIVAYYWTQISGPPVTLSYPLTTDPYITFVTPEVKKQGTDGIDPNGKEILEFMLIVADDSGLMDSDKVSVIVYENGIILPSPVPDWIITLKSVTQRDMGVGSDENKGSIISLRTVDPNDITDKINRPDDLPYGLIDLSLRVYKPGERVDATVYLDSPAPPEYRWYKYSNVTGWYDFTDNVLFNADRTEVTITLTDGGAGDHDGVVNFIIVDPSGLGNEKRTLCIDGAGGCFISTLKGKKAF